MNSERIESIIRDYSLFIGQGPDSVVCRIPPQPQDVKRYVAKFCKNGLPREQFMFYRQVTDATSEMAIRENWTWNIGKPWGILKIRVVPYEEVLTHHDLPVGIAEEIIAPRCSGKLHHYFEGPLRAISKFMEGQVGVRGIYITTVNARVTGNNGVLFATDLSDDINTLRRW